MVVTANLCASNVEQSSSVTCAGDGIYTGAMVLNDGTSATLDCQDASHLADNILWRGPSRQLTSQPYTNHLHSNVPCHRVSESKVLNGTRQH